MPKTEKVYTTLMNTSSIIALILITLLLTPGIGKNSLIVLSDVSQMALTEALCGKIVEMTLFATAYLAVFVYIIPITFKLESFVKMTNWEKNQKLFHTTQLTMIMLFEYLSFFASNQTNQSISNISLGIVMFSFIATVLSTIVTKIVLVKSKQNTVSI